METRGERGILTLLNGFANFVPSFMDIYVHILMIATHGIKRVQGLPLTVTLATATLATVTVLAIPNIPTH